jgi:hypothetical protein
MEAVLRLAFTIVLAILPSLLFLGLWRGLMALRDDELVKRLDAEHFPETTIAPRPTFLGKDIEAVLSIRGPRGGSECPNCGAQTASGMDYCEQCLSKVE